MKEIIKILCGSAILFTMAEMLLPTDKFKKSAEAFIGLTLLVALIVPVKNFIEGTGLFSTISDGNQSKHVEMTENYSDYSARIAKSVIAGELKKEFPELDLEIRIPRQSGKMRIFIIAGGVLPDEIKKEIKDAVRNVYGIENDDVILSNKEE